ncbi:MAG TPA: CBS domain-containing protein [Candidatus Saccharimonadales bacterium]|nr:CBS domain-containing protein [Candidatus Saccharimonadales bacterium]
MSEKLQEFLHGIRDRNISPLLTELVEVPPGGDVSKIIALIRDRGVYEAFLPEESRCGMISARDILRCTNIGSTKLSILTSYVPVLAPDATVGEAARIMADYRIRSVPVSDGQKVVSQVNSTNLLKLLNEINEAPITAIATIDPITLAVNDNVTKARELMIRKRIDHLPIKSEKNLAGMLTSVQIVPHITPPERVGNKSISPEPHRSLDFPVRDIMDSNPLTCGPRTTTAEALESMLKSDKTYVLVTQWEEVQGIATHRDFITLIAEVESEPEIPVYIVGLPEDPFEAETAKKKFKRAIGQLHKVVPDIIEARSVIKTKTTDPLKERGRYEVNVHVRTTTDTYSFEDSGWDLPSIYDAVTDRFKRVLTQKQQHRKIRDRERPESS